MDDKSFDDVEWHDAVIESIEIDRREPGYRDEVLLVVSLPEGEKTKAVFRDCFALEAQLNFGIIAPESILTARRVSHSTRLDEIRKAWSKLPVDLSDLQCFEIETNSTGGVIRIFARRFELTFE
jgi:hypothetical protein